MSAALNDPSVRVRYAIKALGARFAKARKSPVAFFDATMTSEHTQERIKAEPHQRVLLDFIHHHPRAVVILPPGVSKTFSSATYGMWMAGNDATTRGLLVSATQEQASKPLALIRDHIEGNARVKGVFPTLRRSPRKKDKWTGTALTVARPMGIRDPTFRAVGYQSKAIPGARVNFILVDDLLNDENTSTPDARAKMFNWFFMIVRSRLDPGPHSKVVFCNTVYHPEDLAHKLWKEVGWPTIRMTIEGDVYVYNAREDWDPKYAVVNDNGKLELRDELRPANDNETDTSAAHRLIGNDPDPTNATPLWPKRFPRAEIDALRRELHPIIFNRLYMADCRDDDTAWCKQDWVDRCLRKARDLGHFTLRPSWTGAPAFTGLDLAVGKSEKNDWTCFFTFTILPDGTRLILDIDYGRWDMPFIVQKAISKHELYGSVIRVETNGSQDFMRQAMLDKDKVLPVRGHTTTHEGKAHPTYGVHALFNEFFNTAWAIPNMPGRPLDSRIVRFIQECLYYSPDEHTGDVLMASYFAREQARAWGMLAKKKGTGGAGIGASVMAR